MSQTGDLNNKKDQNPDEIWQKFLERDALLDKLQEDRANFWISQSGDKEKEKIAIEKIEKVLNPEIDKLSVEVNQLLHAYHIAKADSAPEVGEDEDLNVHDDDEENPVFEEKSEE